MEQDPEQALLPNVAAREGIMSAVRRFTSRMIRPANERSTLVFKSGERVKLLSTRDGGTELDAEELYKSPPVKSFVEHMRKSRKARASD